MRYASSGSGMEAEWTMVASVEGLGKYLFSKAASRFWVIGEAGDMLEVLCTGV